MGLWGRGPSLRQQEPSPQEMSHSRVGAAATSASAAGASGGERVPETAPPGVCLLSSPACARQHGPGCMCIHMSVSLSTREHAQCVPGLGGQPSSQTVGMPSLGTMVKCASHRVSGGGDGFRAEGTKQEGAGFRPQGPPTELSGSQELTVGLCSIPVNRGLPTRNSCCFPAPDPPPGSGRALPGSRGSQTALLLSLPSTF